MEKEVGDLVGRKLTAWSGGPAPAATAVPVQPAPQSVGALAKSIQKHEQLIEIRLDGATEYEIAETFGKVLNTVTGVQQAKRYNQQIVPDNPQASYQRLLSLAMEKKCVHRMGEEQPFSPSTFFLKFFRSTAEKSSKKRISVNG